MIFVIFIAVVIILVAVVVNMVFVVVGRLTLDVAHAVFVIVAIITSVQIWSS